MTESLSRQIQMKKNHIEAEEKALEKLKIRNAKAMAAVLQSWHITGPKELKEQLKIWRENEVVVQYLSQLLNSIDMDCDTTDQMIESLDALANEHKKEMLPF